MIGVILSIILVFFMCYLIASFRSRNYILTPDEIKNAEKE